MNKLTALSRYNHKAIRTALSAAMCLSTLFCIAVSVHNNIFRDSYVCFVNVTLICGLIFLSLGSVFMFSKTEETTGSVFFLTLFFLDLFASTFFFTLAVSYYKTPNHSGLLTILCTLSYFFLMIVFLTLWLYQKQFITESVITRIVTVLIVITTVLYSVLLIVNLFNPILFLITEESVYSDGVTDYVSIIMTCFCLLLLFIATFSSNMNRNKKFSFICCIFVPVLFAILSVNQDLLGWGIYILGVFCYTVLLPLYLIFFNTYGELENSILRYEKEQIKLQVSAMISQMQPHFLYNSLAVIEALCEEDPKLAAQATNAFSDYLRENMDFADKSNPISFSEELKHIETYVWLEKLRFPNKLNVEYDISCTAFPVPALSIQPMVENAIKHGICKTRSGGTVKISTFETDSFYNITVSDDGIGFDIKEKKDDSALHLGIKNSRYRIREMVGGNLDIESAPGKGTIVIIRIPK